MEYYNEYWSGAIQALLFGGVAVGVGFGVGQLRGASSWALMIGCAAAVCFLNALIPHGYKLIQIHVFNDHVAAFYAMGFTDDQLWGFIKARFVASLVGSVAALAAVFHFSLESR